MVAIETRPWGVRDTFYRLEAIRGVHVNFEPVLRIIPPFVDSLKNQEYLDLIKLGSYDEIERRFPRPGARMHAHWSKSDQADFIRTVTEVFDEKTAKLVCNEHIAQSGVRAQVQYVAPNGEIIIGRFETPESATLFDKVDIGVDFLPRSFLHQDINATRMEGTMYQIDIPGGTLKWKFKMLKLLLDEAQGDRQLDLFDQSADPFELYTFSEEGQNLVAAIWANRV